MPELHITPQERNLIATALAADQERIERLIAKLSQSAAPEEPAAQTDHPAQPKDSPPAPGQVWRSQCGIYAGALPALDGQGIEHLVVGDWIDGAYQWGSYGQEIDGASSRTNGKANTAAMLAAKSPAAQALEQINIEAGFKHDDWHIPSQQEAQLIAATCFEQMQEAAIWTSTQYSDNNAWYQSFNNGNSNWNNKNNSLRVRPVRRFKL